jgi:hypothetical protein
MDGVNLTHDMIKVDPHHLLTPPKTRLSSPTAMSEYAWMVFVICHLVNYEIDKKDDIRKRTDRRYHCSILTGSKPGIVFIFYHWEGCLLWVINDISPMQYDNAE